MARLLTHPSFRPLRRTLAPALCIAALSACASRPETAIDDTPTEHSVRPARPATSKAEAKEGMRDAAENIQAMYDQMAEAQAGRPAQDAGALPTDRPSGTPTRPGQRPGRAIITPTAADLPPGALDPAPTTPTAAPERSDAQKRSDAAAELASQLKPDISAISEPLRAALPLIALETIQPGSAATELDKLQSAVSPKEREAIGALRELSRSLATDPALRADPEALARALREHADRLAGAAPTTGALGLGAVALCARVDGFGRFTPLPATFLAGKTIPAIVYAEVRDFAQRPTTDPKDGAPSWRIELSQELQLILDSDGSRQWQRPEAIVRDDSRSQRSDYYLVQRIDLPRTLSVGRYTLRIIVRDKAAGAEAETLVPIQILADPSLLGGSGRGPRAAK